MEKSRILWIDNMKCICILFVMLSHLESGDAVPDVLYGPFFLTGFLFAAGYVYRQEDFSAFFRKKVRTLLIPWLVFSVGNLLLSQLFSFQEHGSLWEELKWNFLQIRGQGDGVWFVAALFVSFLPFHFLIRRYEKSRAKQKALRLLCITFLLSLASLLYTKLADPLPWNSTALPWHLEYVFQAVFFMVLGYLCRQKSVDFPLWWLGVYTAAVVIGLRFPALMDSHAAGIPSVFALAALCHRLPRTRFGACIGSNTLLCFALHGKVLSALEWSLRRFGWYAPVLENALLSSLMAIGLTFLMALILMIPIWIINRWFPFLLGRKGRN